MRVKIEDPHIYYLSSNDHFQWLRRWLRSFELTEPSPSSDSHEQGWLHPNDQVTVALITDFPTVTVHTGKCYKALIDLEVALSLIRYSTYQNVDSSFKTPMQTTSPKLKTADGSLMMTLGITALHHRIVDFKFTHNFIICNRATSHRNTAWNWYPEKFSLSYAWDKEKNCYIQKDVRFTQFILETENRRHCIWCHICQISHLYTWNWELEGNNRNCQVNSQNTT